MTPSRPWWIAQFLVAGLALVMVVLAIVSGVWVNWISSALIPSITGLVLQLFVAPGLLVSLIVNGGLLARRPSGLIARAERRVLVSEGLVLLASIALALVEQVPGQPLQSNPVLIIVIAFALWIALIVLAIVAFVQALARRRQGA